MSNSCKMVDKADKKYHEMAFAKAIPIYRKALAKDSTNTEAWARYGDCYRQNNQIAEAEECYAHVVGDSNSKNIYKLTYAQMLMGTGKYTEAQKWMSNYAKAEPTDARGKELESGLNHVDDFFEYKDDYKVQKLSINTSEAEYGPAFYKDGIIFTSSRETSDRPAGNHSWTGRRYYSLFYAQRNGADFKDPVIFLKGVQTKYNNSSLCFNSSGTEMILTRNNIENKETDDEGNGVLKLKLYIATLKNGQWSTVIPFQYNSDDYSCAHPALTPDGTKLYFSSDMPGSIGGMDLWVCTRTNDGWSSPKNLGPEINTKGNELFPTVAKDGTIYFSSNGHEGIGGLDLYSTTETAGVFSAPKNLGAPYNSSDDDFSLIFDSTNTGYFSSNRNQQGYNDDIFSIKKIAVKLNGLVVDRRTNDLLDSANVKIVEEAMAPDYKLTGKDGFFTTALHPSKNYWITVERTNYKTDSIRVTSEAIRAAGDSISVVIPLENGIALDGRITNETTGDPIGGAHVTLINTTHHDTLKTLADANGHYSFSKLEFKSEYKITAESEYCISKSVDTSTFEIKGSTTMHIDIALFCLLGNITLKNIYYDLDKSNIRLDAAKELDKLVELLKKYPSMKIELGSHTDCRASYAYNMALSQRRAQSAVHYLEKSGINRRRLVAKGYGESKPVNKCECEGKRFVPCTEDEHQLNRRTEIKIIALN